MTLNPNQRSASKTRSSARPKPASGHPLSAMRRCLVECVRGAGKILLDCFGRGVNPQRKPADGSIVCDADLASERFILGRVQARFPGHNILSEEQGWMGRGAEFTWIIDPLDGTSNYVAGLPWFGVQVGVLRGSEPFLSALYIPLAGDLYFAEAGGGAFRNGRPIHATGEANPANVLCAFGFDPVPDRRKRASADLLFRISSAVRNTRTTNCLLDFCYTADGRLGACINLKTKTWDIAPAAVLLPEAGAKLTDLQGAPIRFSVDEGSIDREYQIFGAPPAIHRKLLAVSKPDSR